MQDYNVVDSVWYDTIGIVRVRPEYGDDKFYIGNGFGVNKYLDEQDIARNGMPYYPQALTSFFDISSK
jgi:hypothetical protein